MTALRRRTWILAAAIIGTGLAAGTALAATLGVSPQQLTVHTAAVSIDPITCTLNSADADSYVYELNPLTNFGSAANLDVRSQLLNNKRSFVMFNLASCAIPAGALITAASLDLFMFTAPAVGTTYDARQVTGSWTEAGVTWLNQPTVAASATASVATGTTAGVTLSWNVSSDVQAFVDGTANNGWRIGDVTESSVTSREGQFRSAEFGTASQQPILSVTYYP